VTRSIVCSLVLAVLHSACSHGATSPPSASANTTAAPAASSSASLASAAPSAAVSAPDRFGQPIGDAGLGLTGIGESGGTGDSIGLGNFGGVAGGHSPHHLRIRPPVVRFGAISVTGRLPIEVIQRVVRQDFGRFRFCYETGLRNNRKLTGDVIVNFTIKSDGSTSDVHAGATIDDKDVIQCVSSVFPALSFPAPEGGVVKVSYPIHFEPPPTAKLNDKPFSDARADDVKVALEKAGCTDIARADSPARVPTGAIFTAKKDGRNVVVKFVALDEPPLSDDEVKKLRETSVVERDGATLLAISVEGDGDKSLAEALMDALITS
jgi:hypothetical protein